MIVENTLPSAKWMINVTSYIRLKFEAGRQRKCIHTGGLIMLVGLPLGSTPKFGIVAFTCFHVLSQAGSMLNLGQLPSFTISTADELGLCISYTVPEMTSTVLIHTCNAFRHLATINLHIEIQTRSSLWLKIFGGGNVVLVLNSAKGLSILT